MNINQMKLILTFMIIHIFMKQSLISVVTNVLN